MPVARIAIAIMKPAAAEYTAGSVGRTEKRSADTRRVRAAAAPRPNTRPASKRAAACRMTRRNTSER
jgi:hypothetical protein